jgi:hypothetical protein
MSVKSVPGCLVAIPPIRIGDPLALVPGLVPHCDVSTLEPLELLELLALLEAPAALELELELDLLLPHAARTIVTPTAAMARMSRTRGTC